MMCRSFFLVLKKGLENSFVTPYVTPHKPFAAFVRL